MLRSAIRVRRRLRITSLPETSESSDSLWFIPFAAQLKRVRGMTLRADDRVVDMAVVKPGASLLTVCENGFGKRTDIGEYRLIRRGGRGVINIKTTERNGEVVALKAVGDDDELMMITGKGIMLRTNLDAVREIGRATQGVPNILMHDQI